jgi:hypothetical protein
MSVNPPEPADRQRRRPVRPDRLRQVADPLRLIDIRRPSDQRSLGWFVAGSGPGRCGFGLLEGLLDGPPRSGDDGQVDQGGPVRIRSRRSRAISPSLIERRQQPVSRAGRQRIRIGMRAESYRRGPCAQARPAAVARPEPAGRPYPFLLGFHCSSPVAAGLRQGPPNASLASSSQ